MSWEWTSPVSDLFQAAAAAGVIFAAYAAWKSVGTWREEVLGKRRAELAEEVLALFYEARDTLPWIRSIGGYTYEHDREAEEGETEAQKVARDRAYPTLRRYNENKETFARLHSLRHRFGAYFGKESVEHFDELRDIVLEITGAARSLAQLWALEYPERYQEKIEEKERTIWEAANDEDDPIRDRMQRLVERIDDLCRLVLEQR